jgi:hypothetical protein
MKQKLECKPMASGPFQQSNKTLHISMLTEEGD